MRVRFGCGAGVSIEDELVYAAASSGKACCGHAASVCLVAVIMPAIIKVRANVIPFIAVRPQSYGFK